MLVVSRRKGQSVIIADGEVRLVVIDIRGDKVRLGFEADPDIPIHRKEVQDAIERDRAATGQAATVDEGAAAATEGNAANAV